MMKLPSFLNFNRSIAPSDALLYSIVNGKREPIILNERTVRGAIGNFSGTNADIEEPSETSKNKDNELSKAAKVSDIDEANIQRIDAAFLSNISDVLEIEYSLIIQSESSSPTGCNDPVMKEELKKISTSYDEIGGYDYLAERYVWNIINSRALWRNRIGTEKTVEIVANEKQKFIFSSDDIKLKKFNRNEIKEVNFENLTKMVSNALSGKSNALFLKITNRVKLVNGAEVYPSQEFIGDGGKGNGKGAKSKVLSFIPISVSGFDRKLPQASMHSQKIGNAIRTIDEWHPEAKTAGAIAVEAYGYSQGNQKSFRKSNKFKTKNEMGNSIYAMLMALDDLNKQMSNAKSISDIHEDIHYLMAMLIRGGVFSGKKEKGEE